MLSLSFDDELLAEVDAGTGQTQREYVWLDGQLVAYLADGTVYHVHNDHLGTPQALTDELGEVVWKAQYTPFGRASVTTEQVTFNIRFPGQYFDAETGLHYNWHRYYDPSLGRYLQSDRLGLFDGVDTYGYVHGNPLGNKDPNGLFAVTPQVIGGSVGFVFGAGLSIYNGNDFVTVMTDAFQAGATGFISGGGSLFAGFTTSVMAGALRTKHDCGKVVYSTALKGGAFALGGGLVGKASGLIVPPQMIRVKRGWFGSKLENIGVLNPKYKDANALMRTNTETGVGIGVENVIASAFSSDPCGCER
ncbi:RHS repeat-associated core domain-containing protein [Vibrio parahaemolyticus]